MEKKVRRRWNIKDKREDREGSLERRSEKKKKKNEAVKKWEVKRGQTHE